MYLFRVSYEKLKMKCEDKIKYSLCAAEELPVSSYNSRYRGKIRS